MQKFFKTSLLVCCILSISACASNGKTVHRHSKYQSVSFGTILETQEVTLGGSNSGIGSYAGSLAAISDSSGNSFLSLLARGIAGGIVGATAEERLTRSKGMQYTVEKNNGTIVTIATKIQNLNVGDCIKITRGGRSTHLEAAGIGLCSSKAAKTKI